MSCAVEDCAGPVHARRLCSKHYIRARRHGDPAAVGRPGRPADPARLAARQEHSQWSPRTFSRYWQALSVLHEVGGHDAAQAALRTATRVTGSINMTALEREAFRRLLNHQHRSQE